MLGTELTSSQRDWLGGLSGRFHGECIEEWPAFARNIDRYSPRLDLAVGPFSRQSGHRLTDEYQRLAQLHRGFLLRLWQHHLANETQYNAHGPQATPNLDFALGCNANPR